MPRLKKKYTQPRSARVAPVVPAGEVDPVDMTLKGAAKRYGIKVKSIRTLIKNYGVGVAQMGKYGTVRIAEMDALRAKLELCDKLNADPYLRTLPLSKRWKWKPRKPADVIANTPEQADAETRAVKYAITAGIPFTTRPDGAFMFLDLRGLICFPSSEETQRYASVNVRQDLVAGSSVRPVQVSACNRVV
jgi:hypothetical protein